MILDQENDRQMLLEIIGASSFKGGAVFAVADLVSRIQEATIVEEKAETKAIVTQE
ncbi:hypothetical protein [Ensifer adhaerens]|uniref:hypothetical protein n=1 Tax=Ensifer adhaerens TaxID=106592 RepID=UPI000DC2BC89|nr:hypothetical protein [Ensifer adhaerens]RAS16107.1 hypothetical protein DEU52_10237 [Ensifer adhaerens]